MVFAVKKFQLDPKITTFSWTAKNHATTPTRFPDDISLEY
jgi:hypothetical protein